MGKGKRESYRLKDISIEVEVRRRTIKEEADMAEWRDYE